VSDDPDVEPKARLRGALVGHLRRYPLAGDTPDGMIACWIPTRGYEDAAQFIDDVVGTMVMAGELVTNRLPDGRLLYSRGPSLGPMSQPK